MVSVGYVPYTNELSHPADRRRLASWATERNVRLNLSNPLESDVIVLSNAANFGHWITRTNKPVYIDLVDGYLGENPSFIKDFLRNTLRSFQGLSNLRWITYSRHLRFAIRNSHGVIVPSIEQRDLLSNINQNVFVIPDDHSELGSDKSNSDLINEELTSNNYLFWEGYGYTLKHFETISAQLDEFLENNNFRMFLVTVEGFKRWGGKVGDINTRAYIDRLFPISKQRIEIVPWSIENLKRCAELSRLGIIPINEKDSFAAYKSENKLLSMWKLGLPVLYSKIPSYERVAKSAGQAEACLNSGEWIDALTNVTKDLDQLAKLKRTGSEYVYQYNRHETLVGKWDAVISQTLAP